MDTTDNTTYRIVRFFQRGEPRRVIVREGLTLDEAQAHCVNPETSSVTGTTTEAQRRTALRGPWFDGYEAEPQTRGDR